MSGKRLHEVRSSTMPLALLDERYLNNGMPAFFVDGQHIVGITETEYTPAAPTRNPLRLDPRIAPAAHLREYGEPGRIRVRCASEQALNLIKLLGMGTVLYTQPSLNQKVRRHGNVTTAPVSAGGAEWWLVPSGAAPATSNVQVYRTKFTDWKPNGVHKTDFAVSFYNQSTKVATLADQAVAPAGVVAVQDYFLGKFSVSNADLTLAGYVAPYNPAKAYMVEAGGTSAPVFIDPRLEPGENCVIVGVGYDAGLLPNVTDYSILQPDLKPGVVAIDELLCMQDTPEGYIWKRKRYYNCQCVSYPGESHSATDGTPATKEYMFEVYPHTDIYTTPEGIVLPSEVDEGILFGRYFDEDWLIYPRA